MNALAKKVIATHERITGRVHWRTRERIIQACERGRIDNVQLYGQVLQRDFDGHGKPEMYHGRGFGVLLQEVRKEKERRREKKLRRKEKGYGQDDKDGMSHNEALKYWQKELGEDGTFDQHFRIEFQQQGPPRFYPK